MSYSFTFTIPSIDDITAAVETAYDDLTTSETVTSARDFAAQQIRDLANTIDNNKE